MSAVVIGEKNNQDGRVHTEIVTRDLTSQFGAFSIDSNSVLVDQAMLSTTELDPKKREQSQLESLTNGTDALSTSRDALEAALRNATSPLLKSGSIIKDLLAPMTTALAGVGEGVRDISGIFTEAQTYSVNNETGSKAQQLIKAVQGHLKILSSEAGNFLGENADSIAAKANDLATILSELAKSPTIDPGQQQPKQPEFPLGSVYVTPPSLGGFGPIDAIAENFRDERDFNRAWADALTAQRQEQFAKLVAGSKDSPLDIEKPRKDLHGESIVSHLSKTNPDLLKRISTATEDLATKVQQHKGEDDRFKLSAARVQDLWGQYEAKRSEIQDKQAAINQLESVSATEERNASASSPQNEKKPGLLERMAKLVKGNRSVGEGHEQREVRAEPAQDTAEISKYRGELAKLKTETRAIAELLDKTKNSQESAENRLEQLGHQITQLRATLSEATKGLQAALRQTCKDLHFISPSDLKHPIASALLAVSIPATTERIPSFDSVIGYARALGANVVDRPENTGVSITHQASGTTITIERRSSHGFDSTLTVTDANGNTVISDRSWNDDLKKVIDHFLQTGEAPVKYKSVESWQVVQEAATSEESSNTSAGSYAPDSAEDQPAADPENSLGHDAVVSFLTESLTKKGCVVELDQTNQETDNVRVHIKRTEGDTTRDVTALLDAKGLTWSLFEGAKQVVLNTLHAVDKIVEYLSKEPEVERVETESADGIDAVTAERGSVEELQGPALLDVKNQVDAGQPAEESQETRRDRLVGDVLKAYNNANVATQWRHPLDEDRSIVIRVNTDGSGGVILTTKGQKSKVCRFANRAELETALGKIVAHYIKPRAESPQDLGQAREGPAQAPLSVQEQDRSAQLGPVATPGAISNFEYPEAQGHKPTTSFAEWQKDAEAARKMSLEAEQSHDPEHEQGQVHRR